MKKYIGLTLILMASSNLFASTETGYVQFEHGQLNSSQTSAGVTIFYLTGTKSNPPACATYAGGERWAINNDWPAAKLQMSILLAAVTAGKQVTIRGNGDCTAWPDAETATNILIAP